MLQKSMNKWDCVCLTAVQLVRGQVPDNHLELIMNELNIWHLLLKSIVKITKTVWTSSGLNILTRKSNAFSSMNSQCGLGKVTMAVHTCNWNDGLHCSTF